MGIYQSKKIKVLILGGGYGALRFVESLIWENIFEIVLCGTEIQGKTQKMAKKYGLSYISFESLTVDIASTIDCIIVALPVQVKRKYVQYLIEDLGYRNAMILEKPLALNANDLNYYKKSLAFLNKCAIVCQRDFEIEQYSINEAENYYIKFPSNVIDENFNKEHMLPHVLSWLITNDESLNSLQHTDYNTFTCIWKGCLCTIQFVERTGKNFVSVNEIEFPNVQYRRINSKIVKSVLSYNICETEKNLRKAFKVSSLLIKIM